MGIRISVVIFLGLRLASCCDKQCDFLAAWSSGWPAIAADNVAAHSVASGRGEPPVMMAAIVTWSCGPLDRASASEWDCKFKSCQDHYSP